MDAWQDKRGKQKLPEKGEKRPLGGQGQGQAPGEAGPGEQGRERRASKGA